MLISYAPFDERSHKLATLAVERFERLGVERGKFIDQLAASVVGGGWWVDGKGRIGEGTLTPNRLGDYTSRHFEEVVVIHSESSLRVVRNREGAEEGGGGDRPTPLGDGAWMRLGI